MVHHVFRTIRFRKTVLTERFKAAGSPHLSQAGMTIVESIMSVSFLMTLSFALMYTVLQSNSAVRKLKLHNQATNMAASIMEEVMADPAGFDPSKSPYTREGVLTAGLLIHTRIQADIKIEIVWMDPSASLPSDAPTDLRQVTVTVSWHERMKDKNVYERHSSLSSLFMVPAGSGS